LGIGIDDLMKESMRTLEESVITSMDGSDIELFPFLPYILQDIWEIGSSPEVIIRLIRKHTNQRSTLKVLDLGCGKGAVSVRLAKEFSCNCVGVDAINEFVREAKEKAKEYGVEELCRFEVGDIRESVNGIEGFDIAILGAIGPIFGDYYSTLTTLSKCINQNGLIIIDDSYIADDSEFTHPLMRKLKDLLQQIRDSGMEFIDEEIINEEELRASDDYIFESLKTRCGELIKKHPNKSRFFENYLKKQEEEIDVLETRVVCSTMVIRRK
jgi:cyclopropane fatty-acyl-phospholipid synthase-like methyltransferase